MAGLLWLLAVLGTTSVLSLGDGEDATAAEPFAEPKIDRYGNQVHEAVGDYRVDQRGVLYERHAPDKPLPKLGPPGT